MFKFDFQVEEEDSSDLNLAGPSKSSTATERAEGSRSALPCHHVSLDELLSTLPETISYSPLTVAGLDEPLLRRDLFDARFQLIDQHQSSEAADTNESGDQGEEYVDSGTDLIPGLYEGGLKTWEGGVDLVEVLDSTSRDGRSVGDWARGGRVLEVGCGTALPSSFLLRSIFALTPAATPSGKTIIHVQDFNRPVLSLVSLPNLVLAALPYLPPEALHRAEDADDVEDTLPDLTQPGSLTLSADVKAAFKQLLADHHVDLRFTHGHWSGLASELKEDKDKYDLILTAETIYAEDSVEDLLDVLQHASRSKDSHHVQKVEIGLEDGIEGLQVRDRWNEKALSEAGETVVLVAAKVLYFGVGGGVQAFLKRVDGRQGWWEDVREWSRGVSRKVIRVGWV